MHRKVALAVRAAFIVTAAFVYATPSTAKIGFTAFTGADLVRICTAKDDPFSAGVCAGYINGVIDMAEREGYVCLTHNSGGVTLDAIRDIVVAWLINNKDKLFYNAYSIAIKAVEVDFPCASRK
jgi:hypothetical protein